MQTSDTARCSCWVNSLSLVEQFGIRYGAHNPACPMFKASRDPVKNIEDAELRYQYEITNSGRFDPGPVPGEPHYHRCFYCAAEYGCFCPDAEGEGPFKYLHLCPNKPNEEIEDES